MGSAWEGDWKKRISDFARSKGFDHIWHYIMAHPTIPLLELAKNMDSVAAVQIGRIASQYCQTNRQMTRYIRYVIFRRLNETKQDLSRTRFSTNILESIGIGLNPPYGDFANAIALQLDSIAIPSSWKPATPDDDLLVNASERTLEGLPPETREIILAGKTIKQPGDDYWAAIAPIWKSISIYDGPEVFRRQFSDVRQEIGYLFATHWCQSEIRNGGFHQFFLNSTGVLAPEAARGFAAIGMSSCADLLNQAMQFFGNPYPREQNIRVAKLDAQPGETRAEWDPFFKLDDHFYAALRECFGFPSAADAYARKIVSSGN